MAGIQFDQIDFDFMGRYLADHIDSRGRKVVVNSIRKGKHGERMAAQFLKSLGFSGAKRGQQHSGSPDSPDVVGVEGVHIEVKFGVKSLDLGTKLMDCALKQSKGDAGPNEVPVVLWKRPNSKQWLLTYINDDGLLVTLSRNEDIKSELERLSRYVSKKTQLILAIKDQLALSGKAESGRQQTQGS